MLDFHRRHVVAERAAPAPSRLSIRALRQPCSATQLPQETPDFHRKYCSISPRQHPLPRMPAPHQLAQLSVLSRCRLQKCPDSGCCWGGRLLLRVVYRFELPEPLSDNSTSVLIDLVVMLDLALINHVGLNHKLVIRLSHLVVSLPPSFPALFHLRRVHYLLPGFCYGGMSRAIGSGISAFTCKAMEPPPSHTDALSSLPSSSTSLIVCRKLCNAAPSTPMCTRRLHVCEDNTWRNIGVYDALPKCRFDWSSQIH